MKNNPKIVLVCDWLTNVGGAEKVLLYIHKIFPNAPIYTSQYDPKGIDWFSDADIRTSYLQKFPVFLRRFLGPFRQRYFSKLDLSEYDLIISVTGAEAKAVKSGKWFYKNKKEKIGKKGIHISYCHVPTQYYWQMYDDYIKNPGFGVLNPLVRFFFRIFVKPLRKADLKSARIPDYYITISKYAKKQIEKYYKRDAAIIHPPVELEDFKYKDVKTSDYYITTSRQVNWKRLDLAVRACLVAKRRLLVIGEGSEHKKLVKMAEGSELIEFLPLMEKKELAKYIARAKGYLFPSLEPFGIAPVEALAVGCPVIAFSEGGSRDYIKEGVNGIFFEEQTVESLAEAISRFEKKKFDRAKIPKTVKDYSVERFEKELRSYIEERVKG